jgi:two-component system sensor histidine kinase DesK
MAETTCIGKIGMPKAKGYLPPLSRPSAAAYIWLSYSIFFFFEPIFRHSLRYWLENLAIFAFFLVMYVALDVIEVRKVKLGILGAFVVLGMVTFPFNPGASTFFLYGACMLPFLLESVSWVVTLLMLDFVLLVGEGMLLKYNFFTYAIAAFFLLFGGLSNVWMARQKWLNNKLALAQEEIIQLAAVAERERIARDLHDVLGHTLSVIVLKAELAGRLMERDPKRAAAEIADVESTARTALAEVRETIGGYRAKGLAAELAAAKRTLDAAGVMLACDAAPNAETGLRATEETVLSLVVREAVTNIVRHAEATECLMRLERTADGYHALRIEDNGRHPVTREGNGLRGMRERVLALGGRFSLKSSNGTRLLIELPVAPEPASTEAARRQNAGAVNGLMAAAQRT